MWPFIIGAFCIFCIFLGYKIRLEIRELKNFFLKKDKKSLFIKGSDYDLEVNRRFGWLLFFPSLTSGITKLILLDQVSRHFYRGIPNKIATCSRILINEIPYLVTKYENLTLREKAFLSLATRHLCRILSQEDNSSKQHQMISESLDLQIKLLNSSIELVKQIPEYDKNDVDFVTTINSNNLKIYRLYRYIPSGYHVWTHSVNYDQLDHNWLEGFLSTEIGSWFINRIEWLQTKRQAYHYHIYLMISGGIDSMTMARIAMALSATDRFDNVTFYGVHINWHKRNESTQEAVELARFFKHFNKMGINFDFKVVDCSIPANADHWDRKTTDFRFDLLKKLQAEHPDGEMSVFCMGHVIGDLIENLVCNATLEGNSTGKQTYLDLFGMRELFYSGVWLFRPFLLHRKPNDISTPFIKDNATMLDIKRRIIRRAIAGYDYDVSRIRQVYSEFEEIIARYEEIDIEQRHIKKSFNNNRKVDGEYHVIRYDPNWTPTEWRLFLHTVMRKLYYNNVKKNSIEELLVMMERRQGMEFHHGMSRPFTNNKGFLVLKNNELAIPVLK